jgi:hypothetical protein
LREELNKSYKKKIYFSDAIVVINTGNVIDEVTKLEIAFAHRFGKPIYFVEEIR